MENLKNKDLAELFELGINLNADEKKEFIKKIQAFDAIKAQELLQMFSIDLSKKGFDIDTEGLQEKTVTEKELQLPNQIDKYKIISFLGVGGMGLVYLGERKDINQLVAIKVANTILPQGARAEAITHEAKILASLNHSNIASLVDWGIYDTHHHFVATEYIDGSSIDQYCNDNNLDALERIKLVLQVVEAVEYAHTNLVIHRDIKPNNILVEKSGNVKLIDFGVARLMKMESGNHQQTIGAALTPSFASPEQIRGEPLNICSDIYSLGAVLFNLLTNEKINQEDSTKGLSTENLKHILKNKSDNSHELKNWHKVGKQTFADIVLVLGKALSVDIDQRYQNAQSFKEDLIAIIETKPIKARKPSKWYWVKRSVARNRFASIAMICALMITLSAMFFGGYHWNKTIQKNLEILSSNQNLKNYSKFLNTTLKGMDAYSGGNPNITMKDFMNRATNLYNNEKEVSKEQLAWHSMILSSIYESWGYYKEAIKMLKTGLQYAEQSPTPHDNISLLTEIALLHSNDLNYKQGEKAALQALALIKNHPETEFRKPYAQLALSFSYRESGKLSKALQVTQQIIDDPKRTKIEVAFANYAQAKVQLRQFKLDLSIENLNKAMPIYLDRYGEESAQVADTKLMLFWAQTRKNRSKFTQEKQIELTQMYEKVYNQGHVNMALLLDTLAEAYFLTGDIDQAIEHQIKALDILDENLDAPIPDIVLSSIHLARYYLLNNETIAADLILKEIEGIDLNNLAKQLQAEYYLIQAQSAILKTDLLSAKQSLLQAKELLKNTEFKNLQAEYNFRSAQTNALDSNWQLCAEQAQIANQLATQFYPKSWELPQVYQYLQDACENKIKNNEKNTFSYLDKLINSPWKYETYFTNQIK